MSNQVSNSEQSQKYTTLLYIFIALIILFILIWCYVYLYNPTIVSTANIIPIQKIALPNATSIPITAPASPIDDRTHAADQIGINTGSTTPLANIGSESIVQPIITDDDEYAIYLYPELNYQGVPLGIKHGKTVPYDIADISPGCVDTGNYSCWSFQYKSMKVKLNCGTKLRFYRSSSGHTYNLIISGDNVESTPDLLAFLKMNTDAHHEQLLTGNGLALSRPYWPDPVKLDVIKV